MFTLLAAVLFASALVPVTLSCKPPLDKREQTASGKPIYPQFVVGNDPPAEVATLGYKMGHTALFVNDLAATKHFYGDILGMREIFRLDAASDYSILYMGYAQGGRNGTGYMTGAEMVAELYNLGGLFEFINLRNSSNSSRSYRPATPQTYSHLGLIVPNVRATQQRMEAFKVPILKKIGEAPKLGGACANTFGMAAQPIIAGLSSVGFNEYLVIEDPDGNVLEVLQQQ